jgi:uncharacterized protein YjiS (DUF1127 family)
MAAGVRHPRETAVLTSSILQRSHDDAAKARLLAGLARLTAAARRWYQLRRDTRQLSAFSDHLLRDIGLGRGEIERAVKDGRGR